MDLYGYQESKSIPYWLVSTLLCTGLTSNFGVGLDDMDWLPMYMKSATLQECQGVSNLQLANVSYMASMPDLHGLV
jgi:hypothetical protein